jgi:thioredoxin-like negative regulator of GroEL
MQTASGRFWGPWVVKHVDRGRRDKKYFARFVASAVILVSSTLVLVLVVLPERYVLSSGFVEAGERFPVARIPFRPVAPVRIGARPAYYLEPTTGEFVVRGPAELFWERAIPLLERGEYTRVLSVFEAYLAEYPADANVRREYALTLIAAGRRTDAVLVLDALLRRGEDRELRRELARTLRDLERIDDASAHYSRLVAAAPADTALVLEWAQALSWLKRYDEAERVLRSGLASAPRSVVLRGELARVYYYTDRLRDAESMLGGMTATELAAADAVQLLRDVRAALVVPEAPPPYVPPPLSLLERAVAAREADDFEAARTLFAEALREKPDDPAIWLAYANFLEYELNDFEGARTALLEVQRRTAPDRELQFRLSVLEAWTNRRVEAMTRLESLLVVAETVTVRPGSVQADSAAVMVASVRAVMGDLHRWDGDRFGARDLYLEALASDSANRRALDGMNEVRLDVARVIDAVEGPRAATHVFGLGDSEDFGRFDVTGEWIGARGNRVWGVVAGRRRLSGRNLERALDERAGSFIELNPALWWRLGTLRASAHLGVQTVGVGSPDVSYGAGFRWRTVNGATLNAEYRHEPAYQFAPTLQTVMADVVLDRFVVSYDRALGRRWYGSMQADVGRLDPTGLPGASPTTRVQAAATAAFALSSRWSFGWTSQAATFSDPAPVIDSVRLFWDPYKVATGGPFARMQGKLGEQWDASARVNPGFALIDERSPTGVRTRLQRVPQLAAEVGLEYQGRRFRAAIDVFYAQARVDGYQTLGARVSLSGSSWLSDRLPR